MANLISLKDFLDEYGESMAEKVVQDLSVIHDPSTEKEEEISKLLNSMKMKPFLSQKENRHLSSAGKEMKVLFCL